MGRRRLIIKAWLAALLTVLAGTVQAQSSKPESITWLVMDMPPYFSFVNGKAPTRPEELQKGELDGLQRLLIDHMPPNVQQVFEEASLQRFEAQARGGQAICSMFHVRNPERLQWLYYTHVLPPLESRGLHVVVRREQLDRFQSKTGAPLELSELLQRPDLVGLLPRDRSFGSRINGLLAAAGDKAPRTIVRGSVPHLLPMLRAGRMDYTLEFPLVVEAYLRDNPQGPDLALLPITEGQSNAQLATVACGRSPAGRRAIELIDAAERSLAQDPRLDTLIRDWRGTLGDNDRLRLKRYFDERAKSGPQIE